MTWCVANIDQTFGSDSKTQWKSSEYDRICSYHIFCYVFFFQTSEATTGLGHLYLILTGEPWLRRGTAAAFKFCSSSLLSSQYHPGVDPFPLAVDEILPELILNWAHWGYPLVMKNQSLHIRDWHYASFFKGFKDSRPLTKWFRTELRRSEELGQNSQEEMPFAMRCRSVSGMAILGDKEKVDNHGILYGILIPYNIVYCSM